MHFSRHAKNEMRLYGIRPADIEMVIACPTRTGIDEKGNSRLTGLDGDDRAIIAVIASDHSNFVITTFPDD